MDQSRWTIRCVYMSLPLAGRPVTGPLIPTPEESLEFAAASGRALAEWQFVESGLIRLFEHALTGGRSTAAVAAFHVPSGFRVRLDMCTAALSKSGAPQAWIKRWDQIAGQLRSLAEKRNVTLHGITLFDASRPKGDRLFMAPHLNNPDRRPDIWDHAIGVGAPKLHAQALAFSAAFESLARYTRCYEEAIRQNFPGGEMLPQEAVGDR